MLDRVSELDDAAGRIRSAAGRYGLDIGPGIVMTGSPGREHMFA